MSAGALSLVKSLRSLQSWQGPGDHRASVWGGTDWQEVSARKTSRAPLCAVAEEKSLKTNKPRKKESVLHEVPLELTPSPRRERAEQKRAALAKGTPGGGRQTQPPAQTNPSLAAGGGSGERRNEVPACGSNY